MRQKASRIVAAGMTKEVAFEPVDGRINDRIDDAYRAKYRDSPYLSPIGRARRLSRLCRAPSMLETIGPCGRPDKTRRYSMVEPIDTRLRCVAFENESVSLIEADP